MKKVDKLSPDRIISHENLIQSAWFVYNLSPNCIIVLIYRSSLMINKQEALMKNLSEFQVFWHASKIYFVTVLKVIEFSLQPFVQMRLNGVKIGGSGTGFPRLVRLFRKAVFL